MPTRKDTQPHRGRPRQFNEETALSRALNVFRETGYDAASADRLAAEMEMKKQSVYRTFGNKSQLFDRCFSVYLARISAALEASFEDRSSLRAAVKTCLRDAAIFFHQSQSRNHGCMVSVIAPVSPEKASLSRQAFLELARKLRTLLAPFHPGDDESARRLAVLIVSLIQSLAVQARTGASIEVLLEINEIFTRDLPETGQEHTA